MSNGRYRDRSPSQNEQRVDWEKLFAAFEQQPTWDEYFSLREKVQRTIPRKQQQRRNDLLDELDQLAMPLINKRRRVLAASKAFQVELQGKSFRQEWRYNRELRTFGLNLLKYAWDLPQRPGFQLGFKILSTEVNLSTELRDATQLLQKGSPPPPLSPNDTLALLLWVPAKYYRKGEAIRLTKQLRQARRDGDAAKIEALWQELALLLGPPERRFERKARRVLPQAAPSPRRRVPQATPEPKKEAPLATPEPQEQVPQAASSSEKMASQVTPESKDTAPLATPEPQDEAPQAAPEPELSTEATPLAAEQAVSKAVPSARPSPEPSPAVSEAAEEVLMAWQEAVGAFTSLVREQAADVALRNEFIKLLQQQISNADQITKEASEQAETKVKRMLMQLLAEPLSQFQVMVGLYQERDFALIYESFTQALARLGITPIGEMDRQFIVGQNDLVRSIDGQSAVGQKVVQIGLGWQLELSDGTVHPLVYPRVRPLNR